jgi:hypothetical protein
MKSDNQVQSPLQVEEEFTPGPWRYCGQDRNQCKCGQVWSVPSDFMICNSELVNEENGAEIPMEQMMANARLIANAPDMYAELKRLYEKHGYSSIKIILDKVNSNS